MLNLKEKEKVVGKYKTHEKDTGSPEVQVGLISEEINRLALHLQKNPKDIHSKRGLLQMVAKRRTLLSYLKHEDVARYEALSKKVGLKKERHEPQE